MLTVYDFGFVGTAQPGVFEGSADYDLKPVKMASITTGSVRTEPVDLHYELNVDGSAKMGTDFVLLLSSPDRNGAYFARLDNIPSGETDTLRFPTDVSQVDVSIVVLHDTLAEEITGAQTVKLDFLLEDPGGFQYSFGTDPPEVAVDLKDCEYGDDYEYFCFECFCDCLGETSSSYRVQTGALGVQHNLPGETTAVYTSYRNPHPIITIHEPRPNSFTPAYVEAELSIKDSVDPVEDYLSVKKVHYDQVGVPAFQQQTFSLQADASALQTSRMSWKVKLTYFDAQDVVLGNATKEGETSIVDESQSVLGNRWTLAETHRLVDVGANHVSLVMGNGNTIRFDGGSGSFWPEHTATDFEVIETVGTTYRLRDRFRNDWTFDNEGTLEAFIDSNGNQTTYTYADVDEDMDVDLTIDRRFEGATVVKYESGRIESITDSNGRKALFDYAVIPATPDNHWLLVAITDPPADANTPPAVTRFE